ncbi:hypothetical protein HYS92_02030 [Candidatus Daviesbacteria bacterium]|nr:hypothetical protein [Candidatus Daviesbacteria bacterium]
MAVEQHELNGPQNSDVRVATNGPVLKLARWFHHTWLFRGITPDHVTWFGVVTQPIGSLYTILVMNKDPQEITWKDRIKAVFATAAPQVSDAGDGKLNDVIKEEEPEKVNPDGDLNDYSADRWVEAVTAAQRAISAYLIGDSLGEIAAYSSGATNPLTSHYRALAESRRKAVHELKWWSPGALGNRFLRFGTSTLGAAVPEVQGPIDLASAASNVYSALDRRGVALYGPEISIESLEGKAREEKIAQINHMQERAVKRLEISRRAIPITFAAMVGTAVGLRAINHFIPIRQVR